MHRCMAFLRYEIDIDHWVEPSGNHMIDTVVTNISGRAGLPSIQDQARLSCGRAILDRINRRSAQAAVRRAVDEAMSERAGIVGDPTSTQHPDPQVVTLGDPTGNPKCLSHYEEAQVDADAIGEISDQDSGLKIGSVFAEAMLMAELGEAGTSCSGLCGATQDSSSRPGSP